MRRLDATFCIRFCTELIIHFLDSFEAERWRTSRTIILCAIEVLGAPGFILQVGKERIFMKICFDRFCLCIVKFSREYETTEDLKEEENEQERDYGSCRKIHSYLRVQTNECVFL